MKLGILGGTFNPIHMGHLILCEEAYHQFGLDKVIFIPSGYSYLKDQSEILPAETRYKMVEKAIGGNSHLDISDMDIVRSGPTHTIDTLNELHEKYPDAELYFIVGADTLLFMHKWVDSDRIFKSCVILASVRGGDDREKIESAADNLKREYMADIRLIDGARIDISSTSLRESFKEGTANRYMLPEKVYNFIIENRLY
ncbi:MAG: nicotinate-nucleotide adenylyltransferase [Lachnospiraceae bacterium]|nr:nicotinate-nucleotide adenylyltransferase [Lachnospiraceae bacterium]